MTGALTTVAIAACLVVLGVLVLGLFSFGRGGAFSKRWSNKIMQARVIAQFAAVVIIVALAWAMRGGQ
ncbi:twin transmembrane helix small protein [Rubrimonas cliftonensis]|uniref:Hypoxia induced protein conserved region n=1 Tax=Rubrimonas cliftonensis TaxID=89524 RepID=A0A1H4ECQ9_9RHOB|nr:twin transmembrane helix small protein [Rubrimonas cliftonensis]SEA82835.1 Hypoxia induced protein conserved region [Rubrimonas cliftonensis]